MNTNKELRESLLWTASSLAAVGKEENVIVLEGRKRTIGEILDEANAALDMPDSGSPASTVATEGEKTPGATWREKGDADPHGDRYACERAALAMGNLTDDELANGAFMNYDRPLDIDALMQRRPGYHPPIAWMTAVKDRIRWLSRKLEEAQGAPAAGDALTAAARDVLSERQRQIQEEGFSTQRDDGYTNRQLADAAAQYVLAAGGWSYLNVWPWKHSTFKEATPREMLIKAGALILAEIERRDRAAIAQRPQRKGE